MLLVCMVTPLFAGGTAEQGTAGSQDMEKEVVVLGNARMYPGEEDAWNVLAQRFTEETGIKVVYRWQGKWNEVPQNLSTARMAGEKVDLVTCGAGLINSIVARSGSLMDISQLMEPYRDRFTTGVLDPYTIGDRLWGFPYGNSAAGFIYYNKDIFDELGIEAPETFDDLVKISKTISDKKGIIPMIFRGKDATYWSNLFFYTFGQTSGDKPIEYTKDFLTGKRSFDSKEEIQALEAIKAFFDEGVLTSDSLDSNGDGMKAAFLQQRAAMMHTHNFQLKQSMIEDFNLGIFQFPSIVKGSKQIAFGGPGTGIAIPSFADRDNLDNTMAFVDFMTRAENVNLVISCYSPVSAVIEGVELVDDPNVEYLNEVLIPKTVPYLDWIWPAEINAAVYQSIPAIVTANTSSEEAVKSVQETLKRIQDESDYVFDWWNTWTDEQWDAVSP